MPSISRLECFGITILEAQASGKPVVVTNLQGLSSLVSNENGRIVPIKNPEALANALLRFSKEIILSGNKNIANIDVHSKTHWF